MLESRSWHRTPDDVIIPLSSLPRISESERVRLHILALGLQNPVAFTPTRKVRTNARSRAEAKAREMNK